MSGWIFAKNFLFRPTAKSSSPISIPPTKESTKTKRYDRIRDFEKLLAQAGTRIVKFYLHISPDEQLARFKQRRDDPHRNWKIQESDYIEREYWPAYMEAYEDALRETSTRHAPWYVIPSNHKWFRELAISSILVAMLDDMNLQIPKPAVDLDAIRQRYHLAEVEQEKNARQNRRRGKSKSDRKKSARRTAKPRAAR